MIIAIDTEGQLCNRLWGFLPLLEHHRLTKERVYVLFFDKYIGLFPSLDTSHELTIIRFPLPLFLRRNLEKIVRRMAKIRWFTYKHSLINHRRGFALIVTWDHRDETHTAETRKNAVRLFRPSERVLNTIEGVNSRLRATNAVLLGIHMRKRDYREFHQGRFFYSDTEYRSFILQVKEQVEKLGYNLRCLLCSDEPINLQAFQGLEVDCIQPTGPLEDLYALSVCDLIIGPPSTFSQWASYYGEVPLKLIWDKNIPLEIMDFGVCTNLDETRGVGIESWLRERSVLRNAPLPLDS